MTDYEKGRRLQIYLPPADDALLRTVAGTDHGGNLSRTVVAALTAYIDDRALRDALILQAVVAMAAAVEPDEQCDPADDTRAEQPHLLLAALFGEADARALGNALAACWAVRHG